MHRLILDLQGQRMNGFVENMLGAWSVECSIVSLDFFFSFFLFLFES